MKINKSIEQGVYVLLMLSLHKNHEPIKSYTMSKILKVSDSYLKKVLRKLVLAGLISSSASKDGGFTLAKSVRNITVLDIYKALDTENIEISCSEMATNIFEDFYAKLDTLYLSELLKEEYIDSGYYIWSDRLNL